MKKMSIRKKLISGFLIVAFVTAAVGVVGIVGFQTMNTQTQTLSVYINNTSQISRLLDNLQQQRICYRDAAMNMNDPAALEAALATMDGLIAEYDDIAAILDTSLVDPDIRASWNHITEAYEKDYTPIRYQLLEEAKNNDDSNMATHLAQIAVPVAEIAEYIDVLNEYGMQISDETSRATSREAGVMTIVMVAAAMVAVAGGIFLGLYLSSTISRPVGQLLTAARQLAIGDIDVDVQMESRDEIGELAAAFVEMAAGIQNQAQIMQLVAAGDYRSEIEVRSDKDVMNQAIRKMMSQTSSIIQKLSSAANEVAAGSGQISQSSQVLASGTTEQAASVQEFSATMEQLEEKTKQNATDSRHAQSVSDQAGDLMMASADSMKRVLEAMDEIHQSSQNITRVIKVIDDIAFQTNILALNAAVEAARAGQHGKGFAVVADEVRNLASKSAAAAKETADLIAGSTDKVGEGSALVKRANEQIDEASQLAGQAVVLVQKMATASNEQADSLTELGDGIQQISSVVQANSATAEQSAAAAQEMAAQAELLKQVTGHFHISDTERFYEDPSDNVVELYPREFAMSSSDFGHQTAASLISETLDI